MAVNRFREESKDKGVGGRKYETRAANSLRGTQTPGSGAIDTAKGDIKLARGEWSFLMEVKTTLDASFSLQLGHLVKINEEANATGKSPALLFSFITPTGRPRPNACTEWVCVPKSVFEELLNGR